MVATSRITEKGIMRRYRQMLEENPVADFVDAFCERNTSNQEIEDYPYLGEAPPMEEWDGPRDYKRHREAAIQVRNILYSTGIEIDSDYIRRDKVNAVMKLVDRLAMRNLQHWTKLAISLLSAAETTTIPEDGQNYFDTDHTWGDSGTQSNDYTFLIANDDTSQPTPEEFGLAIQENIDGLLGLNDDQGEPANEAARSFAVLVPHTLAAPARQVFNTTLIPNTSGTGIRQSPLVAMDGFNIRLYTSTRLAWTNKFAVAVDGTLDKALILQQEEDSEQEDILGAGSEWEQQNHSWRFAVRATRGAGYGSWQRAALTTFTT